MVTGVWLGNDDDTSTKQRHRRPLPAQIWHGFMKAAHEGVRRRRCPASPGCTRSRRRDQVIAAQPQEMVRLTTSLWPWTR